MYIELFGYLIGFTLIDPIIVQSSVVQVDAAPGETLLVAQAERAHAAWAERLHVARAAQIHVARVARLHVARVARLHVARVVELHEADPAVRAHRLGHRELLGRQLRALAYQCKLFHSNAR